MVTTPFWLRPFNAFSVKIKSDVSTWHSGLLAINTHSYCVQPPLPQTLQLSWAIYNLGHSLEAFVASCSPTPSTASLAFKQQVKAIRSDPLSHSWASVPHSPQLISTTTWPLLWGW